MSDNRRILIVEDALDIQLLLKSLFEANGYSVACANHGAEALQYLKTAEELPAVILLDLMMPVMDGYEFRNQQERDPRIAPIPTVVMTADGNGLAIASKIGGRDFLKKPFVDIEQILETVGRFFVA